MIKNVTLSLALTALTSSLSFGNEATISSIVVGSCYRQSSHQEFWRPLLEKKPDLALFVGDNVYADKADSIDGFEAEYAKLGESFGFQQLELSARILATWDDHDFGINDGGADYPHKERSEAIFEEFWKIPADHPSRSRPGVYQQYTLGPEGKRVQVILLDTRFFRSPLKKAPKDHPKKFRYLPDASKDKTMLGEAQWKWLEETLKKPAELRIIASSIQVAAIQHGWEHWGNLPLERQRLFDTLAKSEAQGIILVSGDRHHGEISKVPPATTGLKYPLYEITSSSLNGPNRRAYPGHEPNEHRILGLNRPEENFGAIQINWDASPATITLSLESLSGDPFYAATVPLDFLK
ncbi:MAG: alkaline phosphatase D family protein [Opitutales bacterium]